MFHKYYNFIFTKQSHYLYCVACFLYELNVPKPSSPPSAFNISLNVACFYSCVVCILTLRMHRSWQRMCWI